MGKIYTGEAIVESAKQVGSDVKSQVEAPVLPFGAGLGLMMPVVFFPKSEES